MVELFKFIFSSFWVWFGTLIFLVVIVQGLGCLIQLPFSQKKVSEE